MDEIVPAKVRLFDRKNSDIEVTKLIIEIYPTPDEKYIGHWYLQMPQADDDEIDVSEIESLMDATFAAAYQLDNLIHMIERQLKNEDDDDDEDFYDDED
jgi:hypothetical protein